MKEHEADVEVKVAVVSISTSRWEKYGYKRGIENVPEEDASAKIVIEALNCVDYRLVPDSKLSILRAIVELAEFADVIVAVGGTGISPTDVTVEVVKRIVDKEIDGFGEIFRKLSYDEIGIDAMLSRAFAGVFDGRIIFCLPGSKGAVKLGVKLISDILRHAVSHARGLR